MPSAFSYSLVSTSATENACGEIINRAARELGLNEVADPYASTNPDFLLLVRLFGSLGQELALRQWPQLLIEEHTFNTANGTAEYALPAGFLSFVHETHWNRTTDRALIPVNATTWQYHKSAVASSPLNILLLVSQQKMRLHPTPTGEETIAFAYRSRLWAQTSGASAPDKATPLLSTDTVVYPALLCVQGLKAKWLAARGMDTARADAEYAATLERCLGLQVVAPRLNLAGSGGATPLLSSANLPDTGYGA